MLKKNAVSVDPLQTAKGASSFEAALFAQSYAGLIIHIAVLSRHLGKTSCLALLGGLLDIKSPLFHIWNVGINEL